MAPWSPSAVSDLGPGIHSENNSGLVRSAGGGRVRGALLGADPYFLEAACRRKKAVPVSGRSGRQTAGAFCLWEVEVEEVVVGVGRAVKSSLS